MENLSEFSKGIAKTTIEQHEEIKTVCDLTLHSHAALQSVQTHRERIGNPAYRSALFVRPLDIADQRKMKVKIKSSLHSRYYVEACNEWRAHLRKLASAQRGSVSAVATVLD